ncbi:MAG: hypothetical protein AAGA85_00860 [Bacteroidota bacterium]
MRACLTLSIIMILMETGCRPRTQQELTQKEMLRLEILPFKEPLPLRRPVTVTVRLTNASEERQLINGRMAVGYANSLSRELYCVIQQMKTPLDLSSTELDINRDFSPASDYQWLAPGQSLKASFDLLEYYHVTVPGDYSLQVFYQADEALANTPADIVRGTIESEDTPISLIADKIEAPN